MEFVSIEAIVNRVIPVKNYLHEYGTPDKVIDAMKASMRCSWISGFVPKCDVQLIDDKASITLTACIDTEIPDVPYETKKEKEWIWDQASYPSQLNDFNLIDMRIHWHPHIDDDYDDGE